MALLRSPMYEEESEDILYLREWYSKGSFEGMNIIENEIHKKVVSEIHSHFELLDKTRKLENGRDLFPFLFRSKKYNISTFVPKNVSLCEVFMNMIHIHEDNIM
ncbi:hypothetical protein [Xenorhabdus doucetiae]|uniref:Uncharacterized protein n=2 Tax=Xenorhabdus doucetiae TaxID=351671 RepID=A0ABY3NX81_9GAMM|nr:hypothetical protein [Xenorhabdus doucetiae]TYP16530.1 hypothetical protein LY16_00388 [Xenorhabdus doucetiae]